MLNVPDYVLEEEEEEEIRMADKVSVDDDGEPRCSDFEVPLFTGETFLDLFLIHVKKITPEQWDFLAFGKIDTATVLILTDLCHDIIDNVATEILVEVLPQYNSANTSARTNNTEPLQKGRNLHAVTGEDIEASLGDSLNNCLADVMRVTPEKSCYSEKLSQLIAGEVAKKVNCRLAALTTSSQKTEEFIDAETPESVTMEVVKNISKLFTQNLLNVTFVEEFVDSDSSVPSCPDEILSFSSEFSDLPSSLDPMSPTSIQEKFTQGEKTFLSVLLAKVLDHITESTKTSIFALDFDGIMRNLMETVEEASFPSTCGDLPGSIFAHLREEFGSARLVQAAIMCEDFAFAETFARALKTELEKTSRKPSSFFTKVRSFFKRKNKVAPAHEENRVQHGSKQDTVTGLFSSIVQTVRKPFTSSHGRPGTD